MYFVTKTVQGNSTKPKSALHVRKSIFIVDIWQTIDILSSSAPRSKNSATKCN